MPHFTLSYRWNLSRTCYTCQKRVSVFIHHARKYIHPVGVTLKKSTSRFCFLVRHRYLPCATNKKNIKNNFFYLVWMFLYWKLTTYLCLNRYGTQCTHTVVHRSLEIKILLNTLSTVFIDLWENLQEVWRKKMWAN